MTTNQGHTHKGDEVKKTMLAAAATALLVLAPTAAAFAVDEAPPEEVLPPATEAVEEAPAETLVEVPVVDQPAVPEVAPLAEELPGIEEPVAPEMITLKWILPNGGTPQNVTWPQPAATPENLAALECGTTVWIQEDTGPADDRVQKMLADGQLDNEEDWGWVESWQFSQFTAPACADDPPPVVVTQCTADEVFPTSTNLDPQGWVLKPARALDGNAAWVDGGLKLDASDGTGSAWAQKQINAPFSTIGPLDTSLSSSGIYAFGVILTLNDWDQQIHYDSDGRYWTPIQGIFPDDTLKGGYYETYNLAEDLISDPNIQSIVLYVNSGQSATIASQDYLCGTQGFDFEVLVPEQPEPTVTVTTDEDVDCDAKTVTTTTTTTTSGRTEYDAETNTWVAIDDLVEVASSTRDATAEECPVIVPPTEEPPTTEEPPASETPQTNAALAQTGSQAFIAPMTAGIAIALLAAGSLLVAIRRHRAHN
jgi:LPXTG-motif cell wall-anchored protein